MNKHEFIRRYVKLNKENNTFSILYDEKYEIQDHHASTAFDKIISLLNEREGTAGLVKDCGRTPVGLPYAGMHYDADLEYPQLHTMERMNYPGGDIFDFVFYTEGGNYNGENCNYLHIGGTTYRWELVKEDFEDEPKK